MCRQHRQLYRLPETVSGRPIAQIQQQVPYPTPLLLFRSKERRCYRSPRIQRLRHNFDRDRCRPAGSSPSRPTESALRTNQLNADGLSPKVHELRQRLQLEKIDICLIQETKLAPKDPTPAFPVFSTIHQDRPSSGRGGGLLTQVKESRKITSRT